MTQEPTDTSSRESAIVDARMAEIDARFGASLSADQREQVRGRIERSIARAAALRATALTNADEPEIAFAPYRAGA